MNASVTQSSPPAILLVEDNVELAESLKLLLEQHRFTVTVATNGLIGLKYILNERIDAVVCDLKMPLLEGDMLFDTVADARPDLCRRFVVLTGHAESEKYQKFLRTSEVQILQKPVSADRILEALNAVLPAAG